MKNQQDFFNRIIDALQNADIPYMLTGSLSSSFHGNPRATNDIDIVISPTQQQLDNLLKSLGNNYYISAEAAKNALAQKAMFNIIDNETGYKADLIIRKDRPFSIKEFDRKNLLRIMGMQVWVVSAEDIILTKIEWSKGRQDSRQFDDALHVAAVQLPSLDRQYLNKWAKELNITDELNSLLTNAEKLQG